MSYSQKRDPYDEFVKSIKTGDRRRAFAFCGDEEFLKEHALSLLLEARLGEGFDDFGVIEMDGASFDKDEFADAVESPPFMTGHKAVIVRDLEFKKTRGKGGDDLKAFITDILSDLPEYVTVVLYYSALYLEGTESDDRRARLTRIKSLSKSAEVVEFTERGERQLYRWAERHFKQAGKRMDEGTFAYFLELTDRRMTTLRNEIAKLCGGVEGDVITRKDVDAIVSRSAWADVFEVVNAVVAAEYGTALRSLERCRIMREKPQIILYNTMTAFEEMLYFKSASLGGIGSNDRVAGDFGLNPRRMFLYRRYRAMADKVDLRSLARYFALACGTALEIRRSRVDEWQLMELMILNMSAVRAV